MNEIVNTHIVRRDIERDLLPMARHYNMAVIPWSALGSGRFRNPDALQAAIDKGDFQEDSDQVRYSRKLYEIGERRGIKSFAPIALAYLFAKYPLVFPIVGFQTSEASTANPHLESLHFAKTVLTPMSDAASEYLGSRYPAYAGGDQGNRG